MANKPNIRFKGFTDDWEQRKLGEICERLTRKNKDNESDLPLTISSQHGLIDQRDFFNKVVAAKDMSEYYLLQKGEFAYNKSYSNGYDYGSIKRLNSYEKGCLSTLYICFKLISDKVNSDYLECYFDTLAWYHDVSQICSEGARNHGLLNVDVKAFFTEVTVKLPVDVKEQQQISAILHSLDHLITLHQRKCDETKKLKKFMLQKMFPKNGEKNPEIRFAGFTDDWEQRKLGECAIFNPKSELPDIFEYVDLESVVGTNILCHRTENKSSAPLRAQRLAQKKDVFYQTVRPYQMNNCIFENDEDNWVFSTGYAQLRPYNDSYFLLTLLQNDDFVKQVLDRCTGTSYPAINSNDLADIDVSIPLNENEQKKIGGHFRNLDHLITLHQRKCDKLKLIKKFMLQNMFPKKG